LEQELSLTQAQLFKIKGDFKDTDTELQNIKNSKTANDAAEKSKELQQEVMSKFKMSA
jgi:hypothetical protein